MAGTGEGKKEEADYKRLHSFPLIRHTDMPEEMRVETMELCVTACEKYATNNESAAKMIKESMDKKFGSSWHVVIGEGFGFEVTHEFRAVSAGLFLIVWSEKFTPVSCWRSFCSSGSAHPVPVPPCTKEQIQVLFIG
uniref:Dynein light chain n=2 Tax=Haplochromini TaxID=319058 RepID=A0A3B4FKK2_9CICH